MGWSIKLFRLRGIDVKVHVAFVLILLWAAYSWGSAAGAGVEGAIYGIVAILLLFGCVTLHEFGHSLQALAYGVRVRQIMLLPIGGVSQIEEIPDKPVQELRIAIAGPLVSFALAFFFYALAVILGTSPLAALTGQIAWSNLPGYLAFANLLLGLFNLIPAFPMDGGRVLRAILALRMPYPRATSVAVVVGQGLAIAIGLWGFADGNLLMILIAVFIWIGAGQEGGVVQAKDLLRAMQVGQAMTRHPTIVFADEPVSRAVDLTLSTAQSDFPVLSAENGPIVGLLTREDVIRGLRSHGATVMIDEVMHPDVPVVVAEAPLFQAQQQMFAAGLRALPVVDQWGALVGLLTLTDIGEAYAFQSLADNSSRAVV